MLSVADSGPTNEKHDATFETELDTASENQSDGGLNDSDVVFVDEYIDLEVTQPERIQATAVKTEHLVDKVQEANSVIAASANSASKWKKTSKIKSILFKLLMKFKIPNQPLFSREFQYQFQSRVKKQIIRLKMVKAQVVKLHLIKVIKVSYFFLALYSQLNHIQMRLNVSLFFFFDFRLLW